MKSVWESIRTSLVQKVNDVRKTDRKSEKAEQQGRVSSIGQQNELVSAEPVNQMEVIHRCI
jgi:phage portal protein BeeE